MSRVCGWSMVLAAGLSLVFAGNAARADVKLPNVIASHMVLQQKLPLPIWGTAEPGEVVVVSIGDNTSTATAGTDGKWSVKLKEMSAGGGLRGSDRPDRRQQCAGFQRYDGRTRRSPFRLERTR